MMLLVAYNNMNGKTLLLMKLHSLFIGHGAIKSVLTRKLSSCWLVFIILEGIVWVAGGWIAISCLTQLWTPWATIMTYAAPPLCLKIKQHWERGRRKITRAPRPGNPLQDIVCYVGQRSRTQDSSAIWPPKQDPNNGKPVGMPTEREGDSRGPNP